MKNESEYDRLYGKTSRSWRNGICDFCGVREARHSINGSLWFLCTRCMNNMYEEIPRTIKENLADLEAEEE